ncbi:disease resistance protein UNI-like [Mangifera indica]|uniref:disease resistance protein UNI-like n=1 Tax=Mangifera indica TaxID=29780 RepID=UPI001CFB3EE8|nr:disease resistance protein UNI-like [Mangifera indica]
MEIVTSCVSSISEIIFSRLFKAAGRQIGYLLNYNDKIEALRNQVEELKVTRDRMQSRIHAAERNREIILLDVQIWISKVDDVSAEAEKFFEDEGNVNKMCFKGWCINVRSRYRFSKVAKQKKTVITQLQKDGEFQTLSQPAPPPSSIIIPTVGFSGIFESRESIKNEIMEFLKDDKVSIIGICGLGGVGKTTLVKQVGKLAEEEKLYNSVVMVVVSQTPNIMNIQREIAYMLDLKLLPDYPESARASALWERIKKEKQILIILDDVWRRIKLEEIGIPFGKDHRGCKIMLTSRSKDVCDEMDCDKISIVRTLSKQEPWELFKELVGMDVENSSISPIAREVVAECDGLPIAIVTIASALRNKNGHVWIDATRQLKMSTPTDIPGMQRSVISSLELSIKYLESDDAKSLFFFCSVFPEDFEIPIEVLVTYGVALRWFKNVETMKDVRHRVHAIGNSRMVFPNNFFQGMKDLRVLDLSKTQLLPLPESLSLLANLTTLYLNGCKLGDLSIIGQLCKLEILSLNDSNVREIPISFSRLIHLRLLALIECNELARIAHGVISSLCKLEELYVLESFEHWDYEGDEGGLRNNAKLAELQSLPRLTRLQISIPNLNFLIDNDVPFKNLSNFAIIIGGVGYFEKIDFMISSEKYSRKLLMLNDDKVMISGLINCLKNLVIEQTEYLEVDTCKSVVYIFDCEVLKVTYGKTKLLSPLKELHLTNLPNMTHVWKGETQYITLCNLKRIKLSGCPKLVKLFSRDLLQSLICLKEMEISYCGNLEEIFIMREEEEIIPPRKDLTTTSPSLGNLTSVQIVGCNKLKSLFTPSTVKGLVKLRSLLVCSCSTLEEIVTNEEVSSSLAKKIVFPSLSYLGLVQLSNIGCFSSNSFSIEFPILEALRIFACPKLKIFGYGEQLTPKLNKVTIDMFGSDRVRWMGNLNSTVEQLFIEEQEEIARKRLIEEIIMNEKEEKAAACINREDGVPSLNDMKLTLFQQKILSTVLYLYNWSRVGPVQWLKFYTDEVLIEIGQQKCYESSNIFIQQSETHAVADELKAARNEQGQRLEAIRGDIQVKIDTAERNSEIILLAVQNWISEVDNAIAEAEKFLEGEVKANKTGFRGWCINLRLRYQLSKLAEQKTAVITQLQEDGKFQALSLSAPPPLGIIIPT